MKTTAEETTLLEVFHASISENSEMIDPDYQDDWASLAYGWFLAKNVNHERARELVDMLSLKGWL